MNTSLTPFTVVHVVLLLLLRRWISRLQENELATIEADTFKDMPSLVNL